MKIVIAGAGEVGSHLARMLNANKHDIVVIDSDPKLLIDVSNVADVVTIEGDCTTFAVLKRASVRKCDLFIAVNNEENVNVLAAVIAKQLGAKKTIARIDNNEYLEPSNVELFINMGIDYLFYPEQMAAQEVINLLGHMSTTEYVDFSGGKLSLAVFKLSVSSPFVGKSVAEVDEMMPDIPFRTVAISRDDNTIIPRGTDCFKEEDMIYIVTNREFIETIISYAGIVEQKVKNLMILGGSRVGVRIASALQDEINVKLVEYKQEKAYLLAEVLDKTLIINEDGRDMESMLEEGLSNMDAFVAVTGRSETNILAAMTAKRMGVKKVIADVENMNYIHLAESMGVDTIINKKLITASNIFRFTMNTDVQAVKYLVGCSAEVLEFIVKPNSPATKKVVKELDFPDQAIIGGVVRGDNVFIVNGDTQINAYDRVVVFALPAAASEVSYCFN
ncbi:MAG: Trk system potassium transporter TrkA [Tidjanibacter sp.]|nr:Trk system potassium transporter TrkA [Tidjanibacter sp.]